MLFTRCPDCQTNFRITADALRKADGQVQCGHCATVFNAYAELRDEDLSAPAAQGGVVEESPEQTATDSLSETDEFLAVEESQELEEPAPASEVEAPSIEKRDASDEEEDKAWESETAFELNEPSPIEATETRVAEEEAAVEAGTEEPPPPVSPSLEFNLPKDEWTSFFEDAQANALSTLPRGGGAIQSAAGEAEDPGEPAKAIDEFVIQEIFEEAETEAENAVPDGGTEDGVTRVIGVPDADVAATRLVEIEEPVEEHVLEPTEAPEELFSPEKVDAALADNRAAEVDSQALDQLHGELQHARRIVPRRWGLGAGLLGTFLVLQIVHHNRAPLAGRPIIGPLVQGVYSMAGANVAPNWDLSQYEIMDWVATADAGEEGSLHISALIHNRGPQDQPYPSVHLELKDRWDATVGSRVFAADEYLPAGVTQESVMTAGSTVPASLEVVDPGQDAYGFELDICVELGEGALRCASDAVFQ